MSLGAGLLADAAGFDLRPDPLTASTPAELVDSLRRFRIWVGKPSFREIAGRSGGELAISTTCTMLHDEKLPPFGRMLAFVSACGGGEEERQRFATAWRRLSLGTQATGTGTGTGAPQPERTQGRPASPSAPLRSPAAERLLTPAEPEDFEPTAAASLIIVMLMLDGCTCGVGRRKQPPFLSEAAGVQAPEDGRV